MYLRLGSYRTSFRSFSARTIRCASKPQSRECHGLKRWIEAARKRLHRNVLAIACGRAASWAKSRQAAGTWRAFLENRHPSARIPTHP